MKAIIIDDEKHCRSSLKKQLEWYCPSVKLIGEAENAKMGSQLIEEKLPDIVFLDIDMPDESGIGMLRRMGRIKSHVIFTTAYDQHAVEAFKVNAIDYLLKPVLEEDLVSAVNRVKQRILENTEPQLDELMKILNSQKEKEIVTIPLSDGMQFVEKKNIVRLESDGSYCKIYLADKSELFISRTMKKTLELLDFNKLVRVHHSHVVNYSYIKKYVRTNGGFLEMQDGTKIPVSRNKRVDFLSFLKEH